MSAGVTSEVIAFAPRPADDAPVLRAAFAGTFAATLEPAARARVAVPCDVVVTRETGIVERLADVDVLVSLAFTPAMGAAVARLRLLRMPGVARQRRRPRGRHRRVRVRDLGYAHSARSAR